MTQQLGKKFLQQLGILKPTDTGITNGGGIPMVYGNQAIEYVIKRAQSQIGVPLFLGRWHGRRAEPKSTPAPTPSGSTARAWCSTRSPGGNQAAALLGLAVQPGSQDPDSADAPR